MPTGITYFCNDKHGNLYLRYSAGHKIAQYPYACISRNAGTTDAVGKSSINYSGRIDLAQASARNATRENGQTWHYWEDGKKVGYTVNREAEVVETRAYPGKHKVEPQ